MNIAGCCRQLSLARLLYTRLRISYQENTEVMLSLISVYIVNVKASVCGQNKNYLTMYRFICRCDTLKHSVTCTKIS